MMKVLAIAMLCHAANAAYCSSIGDTSQVPWEQAPDWQKESAVEGVEFCLANPDAPASAKHDSWMAEKVAAGWVYGKKKDPEASPPTHPCIVAFDKLPTEQQFKDVLFKSIVAACASTGEDIVLVERDGNTPGLDPEFAKELETATQQLSDLQTAFDAERAQWAAERESLLTDTAAALDARDKAEKAAKSAKAKVSTGDKPASPRKVGELKDGASLSGDELRAAIATADKVEIVLSDGKREIAGTTPIVAEGEVWREHVRGYMLRDPVEVSGPQAGQAGFQIDGYALLIDGKQVAYTKRSDPVNVAGGSKVSLADDIFFA
jgi:hypothetical protein